MIVEQRTYTLHPGKVAEMVRLYGGEGLALQQKYLGRFLGYFTADLAPGVELSDFPSYPGCNWAVWVWPLRHTAVAAGDVLRLTVLGVTTRASRTLVFRESGN